MPRSARDSEEEVDIKPGRKTRGLTEAVSVDSPLRRSSRLKSAVKQNESSPESCLSDVSNVSNTQTTKITRRRTGTMDSTATTENHRTLRSRINSISSDISEITESEITMDTPTKRSRRSINNQRSKQFTRAGSEAKSPPMTRITRRTRANSMGPEATTENKLTERNQSELISTPIRTRRRMSVLPSEATVIEEKEVNVKILRVTLNRTLPNVNEVNETDLGKSKSVPESESESVSEEKLNISCHSVNEESTESSICVKEPHDSPAEKDLSSNTFEDTEKDAPNNDKNMTDNDKNILDKSEKLFTDTVTQVESSVHTISESLSQSVDQSTSKELGLTLENLLNNSMEKQREDSGNKENLVTNVISDSLYTEDTLSNASMQSPKPLSASNTNTNQLIKEKCKSPCNLTSRRRHSDISEKMDVSEKEVSSNSETANNSSVEKMNTSTKVENNDTSDNMQKLIVETDSLSETTFNEISNKDNSETCINDNLGDIDIVKCIEDVNELSNDKFSESNTILNKETEEMYVMEHNENVNIDKTMNTNEDSEKDSTTQNIITDDNHNSKEEINKACTSESVQENDKMDCVETLSPPNLRNIVPLESSETILITNTGSSVISENKDMHNFQNTDKANTLSPNSSTELDSSDAHTTPKNSIFINKDEDNVTNPVKNSQSSTVTETPADLTEEASEKEELLEKVSVMNNSSMSKKQPEEKLKSNEQKSEFVQKMCKNSQESINIDSNDSDINVADLFQDIPADEWNEKDVADADENSMHSVSTERLENESEAECDLLLVDREAWLAEESMKAEKEKEISDYDSDDTVLIKMRKDIAKAQKDDQITMNELENSYKMNVSKDGASNKNTKRKSIKHKENESKKDGTRNVENAKDSGNMNQNKSMIEDSNEYCTSKRSISIRQSIEEKSLSESHKTIEIETNVSLNKSELSEDLPKKRKSLNSSTEKSNELETTKKRKSLNESNCKEDKMFEAESSNENVVTMSAKKSKEGQSLNTSSKKKIKLKPLDVSHTEESDNECKESQISKKQNSAKKKKFNRSYSTVANIGSDSNSSTRNSDDSPNKTIEIPKFLLGEASSTDSDDDSESVKSMDSDIQREYNLHGKDISEFSDDNVPGDMCRASETESSDPDDNGSDLADFVVDDEDVEEEEGEEEEEKEEEEEEEKEEEEEEEEAEEEDEKEKEEEEEGSEKIENLKLDNEEDQEEDMEEIEKQDEEMQAEKETNIINKKGKKGKVHNENEEENVDEKVVDESLDTSSKRKSKLRTSDRLSLSQISETSKKKKVKTDISGTEKGEREDSFKKKKTKQGHVSNEFTVEDIEQPLNESQLMFNNKMQKLSNIIECSTPKTGSLKLGKFDVSIGTPDTNAVQKDASFNKENIENSFKKSKKIKSKENLAGKDFSPELVELVEKANLSKPISSKVAELNKTTLSACETPTTKHLRKEKLNESAPVLKLGTELKKLVNASSNKEQSNQLEEKSKNVNEPNVEVAQKIDTSLKRKLLKVADNILQSDRQKKRKRKQTIEKSNSNKLIEDGFDTNESDEAKETSLSEKKKKKKKKKKMKTQIDVNDPVIEESHKQLTDTKPEVTEKISNKVKKKQKKEAVENITEFQNTYVENIVSVKKKKKISRTLPNKEITTEQMTKEKPELPSKDIASKIKEVAVAKVPKKKKQLVSEDASPQHEKAQKLFKKKQKLLSEDLSQKENISAEKLSKKKRKFMSENARNDKVKTTAFNESPQSGGMLDSDEGPEVVKFSKARDEALEAIRHTADSIKANKEMKKKKRKDHVKRMQKEREFKNEKLEFKKQGIKTNKIEAQKKNMKRLPDEVLENLSDVPLNPLKKRKLSKMEEQIMPSRSVFDSKAKVAKNVYVEEDFIPLSSYGSTTQFSVVNLKKIKKKKKVPKVVEFKQKMLARNPRQPVSAYLMYLEKQKASGKEKFYNKPY